MRADFLRFCLKIGDLERLFFFPSAGQTDPTNHFLSFMLLCSKYLILKALFTFVKEEAGTLTGQQGGKIIFILSTSNKKVKDRSQERSSSYSRVVPLWLLLECSAILASFQAFTWLLVQTKNITHVGNLQKQGLFKKQKKTKLLSNTRTTVSSKMEVNVKINSQ